MAIKFGSFLPIYLRLMSLPAVNLVARVLLGGRATFSRDVFDVVFVMPPKEAPSWILNAICKELARHFMGYSVQLVHAGDILPRSRVYFFSHYMFYFKSLRQLTFSRLGRSYVFATHLESDKHGVSDRDVAGLLALSDGVICMNAALRDVLVGHGMPKHLSHVVLGAADRSIYTPHRRRPDGAVGFCSAFYPRKSPNRILDIVRLMPHRDFILLGRGWRSWARYDELAALPNFTYCEPPYSDYPYWYAKMSVFCSVSVLEGGPIPLMESMFCNVVPVASRTGFAPDLIQHGRNGFLFEIDAPVMEICKLIDSAFEIDGDVDDIVSRCEWPCFANSIAAIMGFSLTQSEDVEQ
jgi:glycosyltransferase involved in cell wall biosynthesis